MLLNLLHTCDSYNLNTRRRIAAIALPNSRVEAASELVSRRMGQRPGARRKCVLTRTGLAISCRCTILVLSCVSIVNAIGTSELDYLGGG
jgi:hypothetical protein